MILFGHLMKRWPPFKYQNWLLHKRNKHHQRQKNLQESSEPKHECLEPCKLPRKSWWSVFRSNRKQSKCLEKDPPKPPPLCETVEIVSEEQAEADLHQIEKLGGTAFRTCGTAYVLQKDHHAKPMEPSYTSEDLILEEMNKDPSIKGVCDPMPPFQSVELRLIELSERKLHPLYKKLMSIPKPPPRGKAQTQTPQYRTRSGPVMAEDFPKHLKINKEILDRKNIMYECKKAEPPPQMLSRMVEMKMNERPKLKSDKDKDCDLKCNFK